MAIRWTTDQDHVNWTDLQTLYRLAPLGEKRVEDLRTVFGNSRFKVFGYDGDLLVAAGRALSDGADCSYICDVAILPSHQSMGLGREVMQRLIEASRGHKKIILYSVPGKEGFYKKLGFMRLITAMALFEDQEAAIARGHLDDA